MVTAGDEGADYSPVYDVFCSRQKSFQEYSRIGRQGSGNEAGLARRPPCT